MATDRFLAACGQVVFDEGNSGAVGFGGSAAVTDPVAADAMDRAAHVDDVVGAAEGHLGYWRCSEGFAEQAMDLGDEVGAGHGYPS